MQWDTILFWAGTGVLVMTTAISQTDWKHRYLVCGLFVVGGLSIFVASWAQSGFGHISLRCSRQRPERHPRLQLAQFPGFR
jgi:hypothetical protein